MMDELTQRIEGGIRKQGWVGMQPTEINGLESLAIRIRESSQEFIQSCHEEPYLCQQIIDLALTTPDQCTSVSSTVIHACNSFICSDHESIIQIFINPTPPTPNEDEELEVLTEQAFTQDQQAFCHKYQNLIYLLNDSIRRHNNDTALGYISKILLNITNVNPSDLYSFFNHQKHYIQNLLPTCQSNVSIAELIANMLGQEHQTKQFYQLKHFILREMLEKLRACVEERKFSNLLYFVECMLNKNKYQNEATELGKLCEMVVGKAEVEFYLKEMINSFTHETVFANCVAYLKVMVDRMVADEQLDAYYKNIDCEAQQHSLSFHTAALYSNISILLTLQLPSSYSARTKLLFYEFLYGLTRYSSWKQIPYLAIRCVIVLFRMFRQMPILAKYYVHQIMIDTIYKVNRWNTKNIMLVVSVIDPDRKKWSSQELPYLHKTMIVLIEQNEEFKKHFSAWNIQGIIKNYKRVLVSNPSCKYYKQLEFLKPYKFQFQFQSPQAPRQNSMKICQKVVQLSSNKQVKRESSEGLFSDFCGDIKEIDSEEEDEKYIQEEALQQCVSWKQNNPSLYFYVPHLYIF